MSNKPSCASCAFYGNKGYNLGPCLFSAPVLDPVKGCAVFPQVHAGTWCGKYESDNPQAGGKQPYAPLLVHAIEAVTMIRFGDTVIGAAPLLLGYERRYADAHIDVLLAAADYVRKHTREKP